MLGRRIVESFPVEDEPMGQTTGLTVPHMKSGRLTINVETAMRQGKSPALQERTNSNAPSSHDLITARYSYTPDTSYTFGVPNPTNHAPTAIHTSTHDGRQDQERRLKRYSLAEDALATTLRHCTTEAPPEELQIRALKKATSVLSSHVQDAQERAAKLRTLLADRETDPEVYKAMKRERWMEEKRQLVINEEAKTMQGLLASLTQRNSKVAVPVASNPKSNQDISRRRREVNLAKFLGSTDGRTPIHTRRPFSMIHIQPPPRRMTMSDVSPMQSRTSSITDAFAASLKQPPRPLSLDSSHSRAADHGPSPSRLRDSVARTFGVTDEPALAVVMEDPDPDPAVNHEVSHDSHEPDSTRSSTPDTSDLITLPEVFDREDTGTATIYYFPEADHRSLDDILANLKVPLPDYTHDLFRNFNPDYTISLNTPFPSSRNSTTSMVPPRSLIARHYRRAFLSLDNPPSTTPPGPSAPSDRRFSAKHSILRKSSSHHQMPSPGLGAISEAPTPTPTLRRLNAEGVRKASSSFELLPSSYGDDTMIPSASMSSPAAAGNEKFSNRFKRRFSALRRH